MKNQPTMVAKANKTIEIAIKELPNLPRPDAYALQIISEPPSPMGVPLTKSTSAVIVQRIMVSMNISTMPQ